MSRIIIIIDLYDNRKLIYIVISVWAQDITATSAYSCSIRQDGGESLRCRWGLRERQVRDKGFLRWEPWACLTPPPATASWESETRRRSCGRGGEKVGQHALCTPSYMVGMYSLVEANISRHAVSCSSEVSD